MKRISLVGSSGSIGRQVKEVVRRHPDLFSLVSLCVNRDLTSIYADAAEFRPALIGVADESAARNLDVTKLFGAEVVTGEKACAACAAYSAADTALISVSGMAGLRALMAAIETDKRIALANKESLVTGGELAMRAAKERNLTIYPVDSEHSAIFQCLHAGRREDAARIVLTASGGPFRGRTRGGLAAVTVEDALRHPTWRMGAKITVDSATLMNKGLELIEARWLFDTTAIDVIVQPTSVVHSMVEYCDGSVIAQMGSPSMELPIQLALTYPNRTDTATPRLDFETIGSIPFERADEETFGCLALARACMKRGGWYPVVMNAADEAAVALFLGRKIGFLEIEAIVRESLDRWAACSDALSVDGIYAVDAEVKARIASRYR